MQMRRKKSSFFSRQFHILQRTILDEIRQSEHPNRFVDMFSLQGDKIVSF